MFLFKKGTLIDKIKDCSSIRLKQLTELMPGLLLKRSEEYYDLLEKHNKEI